MTRGKITKLKQELAKLRASAANVRHAQLARLAQRIGRERDSSRGKEPTFVNKKRRWVPLSIPDHPGTLKKGTVLNILAILEDDVASLEEELEKEEG